MSGFDGQICEFLTEAREYPICNLWVDKHWSIGSTCHCFPFATDDLMLPSSAPSSDAGAAIEIKSTRIKHDHDNPCQWPVTWTFLAFYANNICLEAKPCADQDRRRFDNQLDHSTTAGLDTQFAPRWPPIDVSVGMLPLRHFPRWCCMANT